MADILRPGLTLTEEHALAVVKMQLFASEPHTTLAKALAGDLPPPRFMVTIGAVDVAWLAPSEWLLVGGDLFGLVATLDAAFAGRAALTADLTHGRAVLRLSGCDARDALAAHCPLDLTPAGFPVSAVARSLLGDAGLFVARLADEGTAPVFRLIVDQTMAAYAVRMLAGPRGREQG